MKNIILAFSILLVSNFYSQQVQYPEPKEGYKKIELKLPKLKDEENYKIDVYISIKSKLKKCEKETLEIDFKEDFLVKPRNIYPFYKIDSNTFATILQKIENCEGNEIVEKKTYNSTLSLGYYSGITRYFYIPKYMNLEYRIWKVEPKFIEVK